MYHLKLTMGRSYNNGTISATREKPDVFTDDKIAAANAVASGFFRLVGEDMGTPLDNTPDDETGTPLDDTPDDETETVLDDTPEDEFVEYEGIHTPLNCLNKSRLETLAAYLDISLKDASKKEEYVQIITAALGRDYVTDSELAGSPTMTELQK